MFVHRLRPSFALLLLLATFAASACETPVDEAPDAATAPDAGAPDARLGFDAGPPCARDEDCDDGVACTHDVCGHDGRCGYQVDHNRCDDHVFCNGAEICDPRRGCVAGPRETCDDDDVCTVDRCNEEAKGCEHEPRDLDGDGDPDFFCAGGTDCDDLDPTRNGRVAEVCGDLVDNDCDGEIDEADCGRPVHDVCDDPFVITASGSYAFDTHGAAPDYTISCASSSRQDLVARLDIPEGSPQDVTLELQGDAFVTALSLERTCGVVGSELGCRTGYPAALRLRSLEPGSYFLVMSSLGSPGELTLSVRMSAASEPPTNETCATAIDVPVPAGATFEGSFVGVADDASTSCGYSGQPDLFYTFTIPDGESYDVNVTLNAPSGDTMAFEIRSGCGGASLRCATGSPARARTYRLGPGTYSLAIEGPSWTDVDYALAIAFAAPSDPVAGDLCSTAIPLTIGTRYVGTMVGAEDDLQISCSYNAPDLVHRFTLAEASDLTIEANGGRAYLSVGLGSSCSLGAVATSACSSGAPARVRARALRAGDYYVFVEGSRAGAYTIDLTATPPAPVVEVSGNDTCGTAYVVPGAGGLFHGNTGTLLHDYTPSTCASSTSTAKDAVFELTLTSRQRVVASTADSTIDTVLYLLDASCRSELACDDDSAGAGDSLIDRVLEPGTYHFVVDAYGSSSFGDYFFEVQVLPPP